MWQCRYLLAVVLVTSVDCARRRHGPPRYYSQDNNVNGSASDSNDNNHDNDCNCTETAATAAGNDSDNVDYERNCPLEIYLLININ